MIDVLIYSFGAALFVFVLGVLAWVCEGFQRLMAHRRAVAADWERERLERLAYMQENDAA